MYPKSCLNTFPSRWLSILMCLGQQHKVGIQCQIFLDHPKSMTGMRLAEKDQSQMMWFLLLDQIAIYSTKILKSIASQFTLSFLFLFLYLLHSVEFTMRQSKIFSDFSSIVVLSKFLFCNALSTNTYPRIPSISI